MYKNNKLLIEMCIERGIISNNENNYSIGSEVYPNLDKILDDIENNSKIKQYLIEKLEIDQEVIRSLNNQVLFLEEELGRYQQRLEL